MPYPVVSRWRPSQPVPLLRSGRPFVCDPLSLIRVSCLKLGGKILLEQGQAGTDRGRQGRTGTDRDRQGWTGTDRDRRGQTGTDRDGQEWTGTDRDGQGQLIRDNTTDQTKTPLLPDPGFYTLYVFYLKIKHIVLKIINKGHREKH